MLAEINICKIISDGDGDKITIDLLEFSLQQQEGSGIEEEEADVFSRVTITLMSAMSKKSRKQKWYCDSKTDHYTSIQYLGSANCYKSVANVFE